MCWFLKCLPATNPGIPANIADIVFTSLALTFLIWAFILIFLGSPRSLNIYLSEGQIVTVRGIHSHQQVKVIGSVGSDKSGLETIFHLLIEIKPGKLRYLVLSEDDYMDEIRVNYLYRFLDGKFRKVPIGSSN